MDIEHTFVADAVPEDWVPATDWDDWESVTDLVGFPEPLPADLDTWDPGLFTHAVLSSVDRSRLSGHDLVTVLRAEERLISHLQAMQAETMAQLAHTDPTDPDSSARSDGVWEDAAAEIGAALHLTRRGADARLAVALDLADTHPRVGRALARGDIDLYRAKVICHGVIGLGPDLAHRIVDTVLTGAATLTSGQLRARIRRLRMAVEPAQAAAQYEQALQDRTIVATGNDEGTANLGGYNLPVDRVAEARANIEALARQLPPDGRTPDQRRADVFLDLLCGTHHGAPARGTVDITVDLDTLAELDDQPGQIPGFGPVLADIARQLAHEHGRDWQVTVTHRRQPVWCGVTRRRPDTALARRVRARHPRCVFPGCRLPATACDLDHTRPWSEGGPTCEHNLVPLCRHHHMLRHRGWTYTRGDDDTITWTSPLGWTYTTVHPP